MAQQETMAEKKDSAAIAFEEGRVRPSVGLIELQLPALRSFVLDVSPE